MSFAERLLVVQKQISAACAAAGRSPSEITLVAVSKTQPIEACREALDAGQRFLGENYAQELRDKARALPEARWHFIGPLQRNKVKYVVGTAELIHGVDSQALLDEIGKRAPGQRCLIQVNTGEEPQKSGVRAAELPALLDEFSRRKMVCEGLMCIPPVDEDPRPHFVRLRELAVKHSLKELSMGMSADYEIAIAEGATLIRVGTALFGPRP
jgi:pyridoxal phosphate enzyme (YggS family)